VRKVTPRRRAKAAKSQPKATASRTARSRQTAPTTSATARRTAPGATRASVLAALAGGEAMTAGQVATAAGLARPTVSTTLSKLAKNGEVQKAERGYRLAVTVEPAAAE
jgi:DNA-binding transcriptional ArsR family regulator